MILKTTRAVTVLDAAHFPDSSFFSRDSHSVLAPLLGRLLRILRVLFVVLFTCGDAVTGGVKRAIERALEAADTGGASSSAGESHVQQLDVGVRRCLRQEDQPQLLLLSNLRRHWVEVSMSSVTVQELAHSTASQGAHGMKGAASTGQGGRQPKNLHRDLMSGAPAFTWLRIPMRNGTDFHPVLLPHVFFSELFEQHWAAVKSALGQDNSVGFAWRCRPFHEARQCIRHFWELMAGCCREQRFRTEVALRSDSQERLDG